MIRRHRYVYCCCMPMIRGVAYGRSKLGPKRRRDDKWASEFRFPWKRRARLNDVNDWSGVIDMNMGRGWLKRAKVQRLAEIARLA